MTTTAITEGRRHALPTTRQQRSASVASTAIPIIGARKLTQLQDNLASLDLQLSPEQVKTLDEASRVELGFPYDLYAKDRMRSYAYGGMRDLIDA